MLVASFGSGDGVVIMTNEQQGGELANELVHSVSVAYGWPDYRSIERPSIPVAADRAAKLASEYQVLHRGTFSIADNDGQLTVSLKEGVSEPLYAMSANTYFVLSRDMLFHDDSGPTPKGRNLRRLRDGLHEDPVTAATFVPLSPRRRLSRTTRRCRETRVCSDRACCRPAPPGRRRSAD